MRPQPLICVTDVEASGDGGPNHWECWMRDPDGYTVVVASPYGSADGTWRPGLDLFT